MAGRARQAGDGTAWTAMAGQAARARASGAQLRLSLHAAARRSRVAAAGRPCAPPRGCMRRRVALRSLCHPPCASALHVAFGVPEVTPPVISDPITGLACVAPLRSMQCCAPVDAPPRRVCCCARCCRAAWIRRACAHLPIAPGAGGQRRRAGSGLQGPGRAAARQRAVRGLRGRCVGAGAARAGCDCAPRAPRAGARLERDAPGSCGVPQLRS